MFLGSITRGVQGYRGLAAQPLGFRLQGLTLTLNPVVGRWTVHRDLTLEALNPKPYSNQGPFSLGLYKLSVLTLWWFF